jgi:hypothetical protein
VNHTPEKIAKAKALAAMVEAKVATILAPMEFESAARAAIAKGEPPENNQGKGAP